jgi:chaperone modulatory protein CbpM
MVIRSTYEITEIIEKYEINEIFITTCIKMEWIIPIDIEKKILDSEDVARLLLIKDLKEDFGVNDESIPIILYLIDQMHWSQAQIKHHIFRKRNRKSDQMI